MTPNPNPSPEEVEDRCCFLQGEIRRCNKAIEDGKGDSWWYQDRDRFQQELNDLRAPKLSPQTLPAPEEVGADEFETVEAWEHDDQRELSLLYKHAAHDRPQFNRGQMRTAIRHGKSLATVAAANDEGVFKLIERLNIWSLYSYHEMHQDQARALFSEAAVALARLATSRSQHEGAK